MKKDNSYTYPRGVELKNHLDVDLKRIYYSFQKDGYVHQDQYANLDGDLCMNYARDLCAVFSELMGTEILYSFSTKHFLFTFYDPKIITYDKSIKMIDEMYEKSHEQDKELFDELKDEENSKVKEKDPVENYEHKELRSQEARKIWKKSKTIKKINKKHRREKNREAAFIALHRFTIKDVIPILFYLVIPFVFIGIEMVPFIHNHCIKFFENISEYKIEMFLEQLSLTFITISVLSIFSDGDAVVYWKDMIKETLIDPPATCFKAYFGYSFFYLFLSLVSVCISWTEAFFVFFIFNVICLFDLSRTMIGCYYVSKKGKEKLIRSFVQKIEKAYRKDFISRESTVWMDYAHANGSSDLVQLVDLVENIDEAHKFVDLSDLVIEYFESNFPECTRTNGFRATCLKGAFSICVLIAEILECNAKVHKAVSYRVAKWIRYKKRILQRDMTRIDETFEKLNFYTNKSFLEGKYNVVRENLGVYGGLLARIERSKESEFIGVSEYIGTMIADEEEEWSKCITREVDASTLLQWYHDNTYKAYGKMIKNYYREFQKEYLGYDSISNIILNGRIKREIVDKVICRLANDNKGIADQEDYHEIIMNKFYTYVLAVAKEIDFENWMLYVKMSKAYGQDIYFKYEVDRMGFIILNLCTLCAQVEFDEDISFELVWQGVFTKALAELIAESILFDADDDTMLNFSWVPWEKLKDKRIDVVIQAFYHVNKNMAAYTKERVDQCKARFVNFCKINETQLGEIARVIMLAKESCAKCSENAETEYLWDALRRAEIVQRGLYNSKYQMATLLHIISKNMEVDSTAHMASVIENANVICNMLDALCHVEREESAKYIQEISLNYQKKFSSALDDLILQGEKRLSGELKERKRKEYPPVAMRLYEDMENK